MYNIGLEQFRELVDPEREEGLPYIQGQSFLYLSEFIITILMIQIDLRGAVENIAYSIMQFRYCERILYFNY